MAISIRIIFSLLIHEDPPGVYSCNSCNLFDRVLVSFPALENRLVPTASIVNYPSLETGIVKLQWSEQLNAAERSTCSAIKADDTTPAEGADELTPSFIRDAFKRRRVVCRQRYIDVAYILTTSNECERFFHCGIGLYGHSQVDGPDDLRDVDGSRV